ncbi:MAG: hypothetical protein A2Y33_10100 [Spirochaetes bacterium GWF1_51_8]|nr:MAG: hypothetical protein A2Y33_10100 [Spirochaetes bacterium GWF1_51_8]
MYRKNYIKSIMAVLAITFILAACDGSGKNSSGNPLGLPLGKEDQYFSKYHRISLLDSNFKYKATVSFGEILISLNDIISNGKTAYMHVKSDTTGAEGYAAVNEIIKNPLNPGVIIEKATASQKPNLEDGKKMEIEAPVLVYIIDQKVTDKTYANVIYIDTKFSIYSDSYKNVPSSYGWVVMDNISVNYEDLKLAKGIFSALRDYFGAKEDVEGAKKSAIIKITDLMKEFPASGMIAHAQAALDKINGVGSDAGETGDTDDGKGEIIDSEEIYGD